MKRAITIVFVIAAAAAAGEKKVQMKDLPQAVQKAVQDQAAGAEIKGISKETEKGKTQYEVEMLVNGKTRDLILDTAGVVVEVEEEVSLDSIPQAAKESIQKKVGGGKITRVETSTRGSVTTYEAAYSKGWRKHEVGVNADGSIAK